MNHVYPAARSVALAVPPARIDPLDAVRSLIVLGSALALILAGQPLPL